MNAGLLTSFIVAGILIVSIITMNNSVTNSSSELTMTQFTRERMASITQLISEDIQKIGYSRTGKTDPIFQVANTHKVKFHSNIDNSDDNNSIEVITWELTDEQVGPNPNVRKLKRTEKKEDGSEEVTSIDLGVTHFQIRYYDNYGLSLTDTLITPLDSNQQKKVKQLYIKIRLQSPEQISTGPNGKSRYITSVWEKRFSPPNLEETAENN